MKTTTLENTQTSANQTTNNNSNSKPEELIEIKEIKDTPYTLVKIVNNYFLAIGKHRVSDNTPYKDELLRKVNTKDWELLINTMIAITQMNQEIQNSK